jgi:hypothetical protein
MEKGTSRCAHSNRKSFHPFVAAVAKAVLSRDVRHPVDRRTAEVRDQEAYLPRFDHLG